MIKIESAAEIIESKGGMILVGKIAKKAGLARIKSALVNHAGAVSVSLFGLVRLYLERMAAEAGTVIVQLREIWDFISGT